MRQVLLATVSLPALQASRIILTRAAELAPSAEVPKRQQRDAFEPAGGAYLRLERFRAKKCGIKVLFLSGSGLEHIGDSG